MLIFVLYVSLSLIQRFTFLVQEFKTLEFEVKKLDMKDVKYIFAFSDGVTNMLRRTEMLEIFKNNQFNNWDTELINKVNEKGGNDNITVIAIEMD